jgi:hypothetical protein
LNQFAEAHQSALSATLDPRLPPIIGVFHAVPALFQLLSTCAAQLAVFQASFNLLDFFCTPLLESPPQLDVPIAIYDDRLRGPQSRGIVVMHIILTCGQKSSAKPGRTLLAFTYGLHSVKIELCKVWRFVSFYERV